MIDRFFDLSNQILFVSLKKDYGPHAHFQDGNEYVKIIKMASRFALSGLRY